jgi:Dolichyl-phosphate-mannose-protein mannosyltransferase
MTTTQAQVEQIPKPGWSSAIRAGAASDLLILAGLYSISLLIIWPVGNFPLNDDWAFARTVKSFLESGVYSPTPWAAMPLLTQTLLGTLFCLPAGFSFNALRCSTLVMSFAGLLFTYLAMRSVQPSRWVAVLATLTLAFNPIYFALSNTFMTDVPFTGLLIGAAFFLFRHLNGGSSLDAIVGSALALAATLSRQLALAIPVSYAVCIIWTRRFKNGWWARAVAPLLLSIGGLIAYQYWMKATGRSPLSYDKMNLRVYWMLSDPQLVLAGLSRHAGMALLYLGLFAAPVTVLLLPRLWASRKVPQVFLAAAGVAVCFILIFTDNLIHLRPLMPGAGNILVAQGIGPLTLNGALGSDTASLPSLGSLFWFAVTIVSVASVALLLATAAAGIFRAWRSYCVLTLPIKVAARIFFLLCLLGYLFPILVVGGWDRYFVPAVPFLLLAAPSSVAPSLPIACLPQSSESSTTSYRIVSIVLILFMTIYSICGTHDYLNWNRARWRALSDVTVSGKAKPEEIDGGFEFNGWYLYAPDFKASKGKNFWWVQRDDYVVAFGELPGYRIAKEFDYSNWLPPTHRKVLLLRKAE